jgi:hypothetical protein
MKDATLFQLSGFSAIAGGVLRVANASLAGALPSNALQFIYFATDVLLIFGLIGIYLAARAQIGWAGLAGVVAAIIGLLMVRSGDLFGGYQTGAAVSLLGTALLGLAMFAGRQARTAALLWLASLAFALVSVVVPGLGLAAIVAGALYGLGVALAGITTAKTKTA